MSENAIGALILWALLAFMALGVLTAPVCREGEALVRSGMSTVCVQARR
ncbi:hypothetical protein [Methylobacterium platani]|nr:hypothetical protein [Methylobacterium platani]